MASIAGLISGGVTSGLVAKVMEVVGRGAGSLRGITFTPLSDVGPSGLGGAGDMDVI